MLFDHAQNADIINRTHEENYSPIYKNLRYSPHDDWREHLAISTEVPLDKMETVTIEQSFKNAKSKFRFKLQNFDEALIKTSKITTKNKFIFLKNLKKGFHSTKITN